MITRREILKYGCAAMACSAFPLNAEQLSSCSKAHYWHSEGKNVACDLCPHGCILSEGKTGRCRTRRNSGGMLITDAYSNPCALHVDPIEKKPLFHVLPGTKSFSIAIAGCNLRCLNCQNYSISQKKPGETDTVFLTPESAVEKARAAGCASIAYTYSEPVVWFEYMLDTAKCARRAGLKNVLVTAGYINQAPLRELCGYIDAVTLDMKSFNSGIYEKLNGGELKPVLDTIKTVHESGVWLELSNLVIPGWTDDMNMIGKMCLWIKQNAGTDVPLHFLRFFPVYKLSGLFPTPAVTIMAAVKLASETGLSFVYAGNLAGVDPDTCCLSCKKVLIEREGYYIKAVRIKNGCCPYCGREIKGIWI